MNATKERIDPAAAEVLLAQHTHVVVAKGKKVLRFGLKSADTSDVIKAIIGPSGNLRAPSISLGKTLVVGFNEEMYSQEFPKD